MDEKKIRTWQLFKQDFLQKQKTNSWRDLAFRNLALHSTDYLTPPLSLRARCRGFEPSDYFEDLNKAKTVVRMRAFRGTLFVVHKGWAAHVLAVLPVIMEPRIREAQRIFGRAGLRADKAADQVCRALAEGPAPLRELKKRMALNVDKTLFPYLVRYMEFSGMITRTTQKHLSDPVVRYGLWRDWLPSLETVPPEDALAELVLAYTNQFGPVLLEDICWWFPLKKKVGIELLERLDSELCKIELNGKKLYMTKTDYADLLSFRSNQNRNPVAFLPYEDHFVKSCTDRSWFLEENALPLVTESGIQMQGQIMPTIWHNEKVVGRWLLTWMDSGKNIAQVKVIGLVNDGLPAEAARQIQHHREELEIFINEKIAPITGTVKK